MARSALFTWVLSRRRCRWRCSSGAYSLRGSNLKR